ncbi:hypothetical protein LOK74_10975 [Brevibacillus humidisoli]|uniref:hypothetical protein n=1 Tax=Brevibacillus humidisoli TaxID=2895522 RepID=UPI001E5911A5|nr:hypothetical protein [Brevibacillus humidisoli]UFJ42976.1 hypothetical protein LOK74_10975 [Brevibacillus humidisoli]
MRYEFVHDDRLGIRLPMLYHDWDEYTAEERADMLFTWEEIRAKIPDRIMHLESIIAKKQQQLAEEEDFGHCCRLNSEIAELASIINDLNIWFRVQQDYATQHTHQ